MGEIIFSPPNFRSFREIFARARIRQKTAAYVIYNDPITGGMLITVYADILFLINFSMDFLALCLAGRLTSRKLSRPRVLLSAAIGGIGGTTAMFFLQGQLFVLFGVALAILMTLLAFGKYDRPGQLLRDSGILWGVGTLLSGLMTSILSLGELRGIVAYTEPGVDGFLPVFLLCFLLSSLLVRLTGSSVKKTSAEVVVTAGGITVSFPGLVDSGCLLTEPISGVPVIVATEASLGGLAVLLEATDTPLRLRMIPADGVCGHRLLRGFVPERVTVDGREVSAVVAKDVGGTDYGGYAGIVPARLVQ